MATIPKPPKVYVYRDSGGRRWRYRAISGNNRIVDASEQSFGSKRYAKRRAASMWPDSTIMVVVQGDAPGPSDTTTI